jgi:hypothetical protein
MRDFGTKEREDVKTKFERVKHEQDRGGFKFGSDLLHC